MTQTALAEAAGVASPDVSRYEGGLVTPSADVLFRLADALGVGPNDLRADTGPPGKSVRPKGK